MKSILKGLMATVMLLSITVTVAQDKKQLELVILFAKYFNLKDALVKSDGKTAVLASAELLSAVNGVKMESLTESEYTVWMKLINTLKEDAGHISKSNDIGDQRNHFMSLSKNIYELQKVSKSDTPVYYQFCPMANKGKGGNWLSKEKAVKNPYYGAQMLTCGKVVETIN